MMDDTMTLSEVLILIVILIILATVVMFTVKGVIAGDEPHRDKQQECFDQGGQVVWNEYNEYDGCLIKGPSR